MATKALPAIAGMNNASTRRAALMMGLAGASFVTFAIPAAARAAPDRSAWNSALAEYRAAEGAMQAFDLSHLTPASEAYMSARRVYPKGNLTDEARAALAPAVAAYDAIQKRFDMLVDKHGDAALILIKTPAPNAAAMAEKVRLIITHDIAGWTEDSREACLAAVLADADHFASQEA